MNPRDLVKPSIRELLPYTLRQYQYELKLNQNENPFDIPLELKDKLLAYARRRSWSRYPDFVPEEFHQKLAEYTGWAKEGILVGNGSNELIKDICILILEKGSRVVIPVPTFTLYKLISTALGAEVVEVKLKADYTFDMEALNEAVAVHSPALIFFSSPNNPTGCILPMDGLEKILQETNSLVVVDEAYYEFSGTTCLPLLKKHRNLIILRTFSKAFSLAGLRVGYLIADPDLVQEIAKVKLPYNINFFSQIVATYVLENRTLLQKKVEYIVHQKDMVYQALSGIPGVKPYPSYGNFILFETLLDVKSLFFELLKKGVLVRDVSGYPMLSRALRVTISKEEENRRFIRTLREAVDAAQ
ncbi:MAG: histidinol-phosphate transaminase [Candidatus Latescibacteria bacterium]|nr:histidinol-phosphate transaminase [Candidatus Latescibacterota bacterium]